MRIAFAALLSLLLAAPAAAQIALPYGALPGTSWVAIAWKDQALDPAAAPRIAFGAAYQLSGFGGCNWFNGYYALHGERIILVARGWTKKYCAGRPFVDSQMSAAMKRVARLALEPDGNLAAHAEDGTVIFRFRRAGPNENG